MVKIELIKKEIKCTYGEQRVVATYAMYTEQDSCKNEYVIEAEIMGIASLDPHIAVSSVTVIDKDNSNEWTLTEEGAQDLFETKL